MDLMLLGLTIGMANALLAVGLVLIYMSNRVINFAHGELGAFAVAMMLALTRVAHLNYWLALLGSLAATAALAGLVERTIIRRLYTSPRLIVLIATIGVAQIVTVLRLVLPKPEVAGEKVLFGSADDFPVPFSAPVVEFGRVVIQPQHVMVLVAGPLLVLAVVAFLRSSIYGLSIRAAAENAPRARLLGIPVGRVSMLSWILAALLAAAGAILLAPVIGFSATEAVGLPLLLRGLAAATIARFTSVGTAFTAGLAFGLLDQLVIFYTGRAGLTDAIVLGIVMAVLLARRAETRRTTDAEESSWAVNEPVRPLPPEIARHPRWRLTVGISAALGVGALLAAPALLSSPKTFLLATIAAVGIVTVSVTVLSGWAGQLSLGQWAIAGFGAVLGSRLMMMGVPFWGAFALSIVAGGLVALLLGIPALRLPGTLLAVVTLGFAVVASTWLFDQSWFKGTGFVDRPAFLGVDGYYFLALAVLGGALWVVRELQHSRFGRNVIAVRDNPRQAAAMGIPVVRTRLTAFVVSGALAGLGGFLWSAGVRVADPVAFGALDSLRVLSAAIIGGLGSVPGALLGTGYMLGVPFFGADISPYIGVLASGVGLLLLVLVFPGGLARLALTGRDRLAHLVTGIDPNPDVVPVVDPYPSGSAPAPAPRPLAGAVR